MPNWWPERRHIRDRLAPLCLVSQCAGARRTGQG